MPLHAPSRSVLRRSVAFGAAAALTCTLAVAVPTVASANIVTTPVTHSADDAALSLTPIGTFETGVFDESAAEIVVAHGDRLFVVNALAGSVDVLDYSDPANIVKEFEISSAGTANSVAIREDGLGVIAFEAADKTADGTLVFFDADAPTAAVLGIVTVGALPDMVTISSDGQYAVVANEAEPADDFSVDPEGSIGVVALPTEKAAPAQSAVRFAGFGAFEGENLPADVRVFGPDVAAPGQDPATLATNRVSRNLEPEYIALDGLTAYAALQEANAFAVVDLATATVTNLLPLGFKDHGGAGSGIDPSDKDDAISIRTFDGLKGIYMPDAIDSYEANGETYLVSANEGDAREWGDYAEGTRVKDLVKDGHAAVCDDSPLAGSLGDADLGRLNVTAENGFDTDAGCYSELYAFGSRSFSIWTTSGEQVWDSGTSFEDITAAAAPDFFNSNHSESNFEGRSEDKGPEPEAVTIGEVDGRTYAFVGFERVGGIAAYDVTSPAASKFVTYVNNRDFSVSVEDGGDLAQAGDLGLESIAFIPAEDSPTGEPLLAAGNEVSGTTTLFAIESALAPETTDVTVLTVNDFHGRIEQNLGNGEAGAAVLAGAVDAFEALNPNTLFVSAGDNIGASTFTSFIQQDEPTIEALVAAGLDLGAAGNHEFDAGFADLTGRVTDLFGDKKFNLGANIYLKGTKTPALPEYAIEKVDGVRIGFIGTVTEQTAGMVSPTGIADIEFGSQLEAANRVADELVSGDLADVIVLLTHEGSETGQCDAVATDPTAYGELIRGASADIDAIVSGHTHQSYVCDVPVDGAGVDRPVIQAHQYGTTLGKLEISVDSDSRELVSIGADLVPLVVDGAAAYPEDPAVKAIVDEAIAVADVEGAVEVGAVTSDIVRGGTPAGADRGVESTLGNLVADMYLWATSNEDYAGTPAEIGLMNPGGLRADLLYGTDGTMTYRDVANVQPFANTLVTVTLTGEQIESALEEQWQPDGSSRPKLHLGVSDGFSYEYDPTAARGERIVSMSLNGTEIARTDEYTVVTNSFLAGGGDNFFTFAEGTDRTDTGQVDLQASVAYFAAKSPVAPAELGRATVVSTGGGDNGEGDNGGELPGNGGGGDNGGELPGTGGYTDAELGAALESADISYGTGRVEQGDSFDVSLAGLLPGQQIAATLFSDPIVITGIPAADANGNLVFTVTIPSDLAPGAHRLVLTSGDGSETLGVTVFADGTLAATGGDFPIGFVTVLAVMTMLAGGLLVLRRRQTV